MNVLDYILQRCRDDINSVGGLCLVDRALARAGFQNRVASRRKADIFKTMIALLAQGRTDFSDIELFRHSAYFKEALGLRHVPSQSTLRQRLDQSTDADAEGMRALLLAMLKKVTFTSVRTPHSEYIPVDADVTPFDNSNSKKEGVSRTYKNRDGFAPLLAYIGLEGYVLDCELRPGSQHSQKGAPEFFRRMISSLGELGVLDECVVRLDSAHDATDNLHLFSEAGCKFIIKRNLRKESIAHWVDLAKSVGDMDSPRQGKRVWCGTVSHIQPPAKDGAKGRAKLPLFVTFRVTERTSKPNGQTLLLPEHEVETWWTNLPDSATEVIALYNAHGTSEQFHSELKSDMGIERLPSGKFATNEKVLLLGAVAFNVLRTIGQESLRAPETLPMKLGVQRRRVGSVMRDYIYIACKRVRHAGRVFLNFGRSCALFPSFCHIYDRLAVSSCPP